MKAKIQEMMGMKGEVEELRAENQALRATLSTQGPSDEDKSNAKVQISRLKRVLK